MKLNAVKDQCFTCPKTGKTCIPLSGGAGYYLKLTSVEDHIPGAIWVAVWHNSRGCIGADTSISAGVKRANEAHKSDVRRWTGDRPSYEIQELHMTDKSKNDVGNTIGDDWPDIPNTPEQRDLTAKHNAEIRVKYPNLVQVSPAKLDATDPPD